MGLAMVTAVQIEKMFIIILVGVFCEKKRIIDSTANERLSRLLLSLISPVLIFTSYQQEFSADKWNGLLSAFFMAVVSHGIAILVSAFLIRRKSGENSGIERFSVIYSNCGFMGIPLCHAIFGQEGVFYVTAYLTVFNLLVWTHGVLLMKGRTDISSVLQSMKTPCILAVLAGLLCFVFRLRLPDLLLDPMSAIADMNTPVAMLVAGVSMGGMRLRELLGQRRIYALSVMRLMLVPIITYAALRLLGMEGVPMMVTILAAACPSASTGAMLAIKYHKDHTYASAIFGLSTLFSIMTIPLVMMVAG